MSKRICEYINFIVVVCLCFLSFLYVTYSLGFGKSSRVDGKQIYWWLRVQDCVWGWKESPCWVKFSTAIHPHISRLGGETQLLEGEETIQQQNHLLHTFSSLYVHFHVPFIFFLSFIDMFFISKFWNSSRFNLPVEALVYSILFYIVNTGFYKDAGLVNVRSLHSQFVLLLQIDSIEIEWLN